MIPILISVLIGLGLAIGDFLMKKWMLLGYAWSGESLGYVVAALFVYCVSLLGYGYLLSFYNLNVATLVSVTVNVFVVMIIGTFLFNEPLNLYHGAGIALCFAGLSLILLN